MATRVFCSILRHFIPVIVLAALCACAAPQKTRILKVCEEEAQEPAIEEQPAPEVVKQIIPVPKPKPLSLPQSLYGLHQALVLYDRSKAIDLAQAVIDSLEQEKGRSSQTFYAGMDFVGAGTLKRLYYPVGNVEPSSTALRQGLEGWQDWHVMPDGVGLYRLRQTPDRQAIINTLQQVMQNLRHVQRKRQEDDFFASSELLSKLYDQEFAPQEVGQDSLAVAKWYLRGAHYVYKHEYYDLSRSILSDAKALLDRLEARYRSQPQQRRIVQKYRHLTERIEEGIRNKDPNLIEQIQQWVSPEE